MKRFIGLGFALCAMLVVVVPAQRARAQAVVSDPVLERLATQTWFKDISNAENIAQTAQQSLQTQINTYQQYQTMLQQLTYFPQMQWRQVQGEIQQLAQVTKVGYGISAYDSNGTLQLQQMFPTPAPGQAASGAMTPAHLDEAWNAHMQSALQNSANAVGVRMSQMQTEEQQLTILRNMSNNPNISQKQAVQMALMIATQQLEELRAIERAMLQHFDTQYAYMMQNGSSTVQDTLVKLRQTQGEQSFWTQGERMSAPQNPNASYLRPQAAKTPAGPVIPPPRR